MIIGVCIFSFVSSAITNIISNLDIVDVVEEELLHVLNKINSRHPMPPELYHDLKGANFQNFY